MWQEILQSGSGEEVKIYTGIKSGRTDSNSIIMTNIISNDYTIISAHESKGNIAFPFVDASGKWGFSIRGSQTFSAKADIDVSVNFTYIEKQ